MVSFAIMDKLAFIFNNFYNDYITEIIDTFGSSMTPELKTKLQKVHESRERRSSTSRRNITRFNDHFVGDVKEKALDAPSSSILEEYSVQHFPIIKRVTMLELMEQGVDKKSLASYFYLFGMLAAVYAKIDDADLNDSDDDEDDVTSATKKGLSESSEDLLDACLTTLRDVQAGQENVDVQARIKDELLAKLMVKVQETSIPLKGSVPEGIPSAFDDSTAEMLKNTKIGSLAKEISEELDLSSLKFDKPEDILNMGGDNNLLTNIISKVGSKIHQKLDNGDIKHEDLMSEAMSMLSMVGGGAAGGKGGMPNLSGILNNPMFKDVMKNMSGMTAKMNDVSKQSATKERLRKKFDEKNGKVL